MTRTPGTAFRTGLLFCCSLWISACGGDAAPASDTASAAGASPGAGAETRAGGEATVEAWEGEVTGGYTGNRLSFTLSEGARIADVTFEGHWDCADGIETTTAGPEGSFPVENGRIEITSVDPPEGGASSTRFVLTGQVGDARAEGTLRININALGCDTGELAWSAAPVAG